MRVLSTHDIINMHTSLILSLQENMRNLQLYIWSRFLSAPPVVHLFIIIHTHPGNCTFPGGKLYSLLYCLQHVTHFVRRKGKFLSCKSRKQDKNLIIAYHLKCSEINLGNGDWLLLEIIIFSEKLFNYFSFFLGQCFYY